MSVWISTKDRMPPINEQVLILFKDKKDELKEENLFYGITSWIKDLILVLKDGHILRNIQDITR